RSGRRLRNIQRHQTPGRVAPNAASRHYAFGLRDFDGGILKDNARPEAREVYAAMDMPWATLVGQIAQAYGSNSPPVAPQTLENLAHRRKPGPRRLHSCHFLPVYSILQAC